MNRHRILKRSDQTRAFTLVELLVVIGIIALLISILLPALTAARRAGDSIKCKSNLRQVGLALLQYGQQFNGRFPATFYANQDYSIPTPGVDGGTTGGSGLSVFWWQRLQIMGLLPGAYEPSKSPLVCPDQGTPFQPFGGPTETVLFNCSYGINDYLTIHDGAAWSADPNVDDGLDDISPVSYGIRQVEWPKAISARNSSDKIVAGDILNGYVLDAFYPNSPALSPAACYDWRRHANPKATKGTCNVLYLDGHVSSVTQGTDALGVMNDINSVSLNYGPQSAARGIQQTQSY